MNFINSHASSEADKRGVRFFAQQIKAATSVDHRRLENQTLLSSIMSPNVTVGQYATYLKIMHDIERVYEKAVWPMVAFLFRQRSAPSSTQKIKGDLLSIDEDTSVGIAYTLNAEYRDIPFLLGFMYVVEGSRLGGKVIYKHIQQTLGFTAEKGASFLASTGVDIATEWMAFLNTLCDFANAQDKIEEIIQGARHAFASIYDHFEINAFAHAD